ncbi:ClpP/crotonase-like domain-containing protein [Pisolithus orientalis]|uniref:ClpP/crotonase-like domain-containing protein n=1 Tax=Pisolithus orientalis TaxID=936130 RepID=UPI002225520D|nr:ClpP/crotonase-like domain-containing protein [Pisolithus orientalis]KAI5991737.1 ClpP/crotonase-like domain-containing protein [Pisolithus orientalis]
MQPSSSPELTVSIPQEHTLLLALNRPRQRNAITPDLTREIAHVLDWFDSEPSLWVVVLTGEGDMFCAGADLKSWHASQSSNVTTEQQDIASSPHGFAALSRRRTSLKLIIAAVNGPAYGGGVEIILNCDLVVASTDAVFGLLEVKRGVVAAQGAIPRLTRVAGHQLASEMLLLGSTITALEARDRFRFINIVTSPAEVLPTALALARTITSNSPDAVQSTKEGLLIAQRVGNVDEAVVSHALSAAGGRVWNGRNVKEGLAAFVEKRIPKWTNPAKL